MDYPERFYKHRPVLVTGGAGFIGSHVTQQLVAAGARVTILDNFSSGTIENLQNIAHNIRIIPGDITDHQTCKRAVQGATHIFHLAAAISVAESQENPEKYHRINVDGTRNLLEAAAASSSVQRFIFSSSAAVYGAQSTPCHENLAPAPESPYALTKLEGEKLCTTFSTQTHLQTVALRYFNVYGPRQRITGGYAAVIPNFVQKIRSNLPLQIFGTGTQTRDFVPVEEVARANLIAGCAPHLPYRVINVASGRSISLLQLIEKLSYELHRPQPELKFLPPRPGDILHSQADCSRYQDLKQSIDTHAAS